MKQTKKMAASSWSTNAVALVLFQRGSSLRTAEPRLDPLVAGEAEVLCCSFWQPPWFSGEPRDKRYQAACEVRLLV